MRDKRYPTRMHEVLGVELGERFQIKGQTPWYDQSFFVDENGDVRREGWSPPFDRAAVYLINNPERITRRPRLTEEQVAQLKALVTLGFKWLCQDSNDYYMVYVNKPVKSEYGWDRGGHYVLLGFGLPADVITDLVSWSDPEPLNIVQTLRDAGRLEGEA